MQKTCTQCSTSFEITDRDLAFYEHISPVIDKTTYSIPPPTLCPYCRWQRRIVVRNERSLYKRSCGLCDKPIITSYAGDVPFPVYCQQCWWGDKWDPMQYGREYDFSQTFFDQYKQLRTVVPRFCLLNKGSQNSEYCNYAGYNKNCFMAMGGSWYNEDCIHVTYSSHCQGCIDCFGPRNSELCYETVWGNDLYSCIYCIDCSDCSDCAFSLNLRGCKNCLFCSNLRNKEYFVENKPVSKEEYEKLRNSMRSFTSFSTLLKQFHEWRSTCTRPAVYNTQCENCTGDYLRSCKNVRSGFITTDMEDASYTFITEEGKDFMDCSCAGYDGCELYYECCCSGNGGIRNCFCFFNLASNDVYYCDAPQSCKDCFGCISLQQKQYCILNKQYTQQEYKDLVPKIIEHMQSTGEWGEFFPIELCPFGYNESTSQEYCPMTKEAVLERGWPWKEKQDEEPQVDKIIASEQLPDSINDTPNDLLNWAIKCQKTGRLFRIVKQELDFYRQMQLPIPRIHFDERHRRRMERKNPPKLYWRSCGKCNQEMWSSFAPEKSETVYCEECYLATVY